MWKPFEVEDQPMLADKESSNGLPGFTPSAPRTFCTPKLKFKLIVGLVFAIMAGIVIAAIVVQLKKSPDPPELSTGPCVSECPHCRKGIRNPPAESLPTPDLKPKSDPWYIMSNTESEPITYNSKDKTLRVDYIPGKFGSPNGADFRSNPRLALPSDSAVLSYSVFFPEDFPWTRGGKLPGFCISSEMNDCATGSEWAWGAGSLRMMWREGGRGIGYVYLPLQAGFIGARWSTWSAQGSSYKRVAKDTGNTGDDVFCKVDGGLRFKAGEWNDVTMVVAMNTPGFANGWISLTVNGDSRSVKGVRWRGLSSKVQVTSVLFASFFGGSDETWATDKKTYALFKDFKFSAPADLDASNI